MNQAFLYGTMKNVGELEKVPENYITEKVLCFEIETKSILKEWIDIKDTITVHCLATSSTASQLLSISKTEGFSGEILLTGHLGVVEEKDNKTRFIVDNFELV